MPILLYVVILAVVQGLTEFLPVSSKTHLMFAQHFMDRTPDLMLTVVLHGGSLLAILVYYRKNWIELFQSRRREIGLLVVGTIPAAVVGLTLKDRLEAAYGEAFLLASVLLIVNGTFLFVADRFSRERHGLEEAPLWKILVIGVAQAGALLPGISRSGSTIGAGMLCGLKRQDAVRFSFFLGAAAVGGALVLKTPDLLENSANLAFLPILIGTLVAFAVSLAAIRVVEMLSLRGRFALFAVYCAVAGLSAALYFWQGA